MFVCDIAYKFDTLLYLQYYTILRIFRSRCRNQSKGDQTQANRRDQRIKVLKQFRKTMVYNDCKDPMLDIKESRSTAPHSRTLEW